MTNFVKPKVGDLNHLAWAFTWRYYLFWCAIFILIVLGASIFPSLHLLSNSTAQRFLFESFLLPMGLFQYLFLRKSNDYKLVKIVGGNVFDEAAFRASFKNLSFKERIKAGKEGDAKLAHKLSMKLTWVFLFFNFLWFLFFLFLTAKNNAADAKIFFLLIDLLLVPFRAFICSWLAFHHVVGREYKQGSIQLIIGTVTAPDKFLKNLAKLSFAFFWRIYAILVSIMIFLALFFGLVFIVALGTKPEVLKSSSVIAYGILIIYLLYIVVLYGVLVWVSKVKFDDFQFSFYRYQPAIPSFFNKNSFFAALPFLLVSIIAASVLNFIEGFITPHIITSNPVIRIAWETLLQYFLCFVTFYIFINRKICNWHYSLTSLTECSPSRLAK